MSRENVETLARGQVYSRQRDALDAVGLSKQDAHSDGGSRPGRKPSKPRG